MSKSFISGDERSSHKNPIFRHLFLQIRVIYSSVGWWVSLVSGAGFMKLPLERIFSKGWLVSPLEINTDLKFHLEIKFHYPS